MYSSYLANVPMKSFEICKKTMSEQTRLKNKSWECLEYLTGSVGYSMSLALTNCKLARRGFSFAIS